MDPITITSTATHVEITVGIVTKTFGANEFWFKRYDDPDDPDGARLEMNHKESAAHNLVIRENTPLTIDGNSSFADMAAIVLALNPVFFLASGSGTGSGVTPAQSAAISANTAARHTPETKASIESLGVSYNSLADKPALPSSTDVSANTAARHNPETKASVEALGVSYNSLADQPSVPDTADVAANTAARHDGSAQDAGIAANLLAITNKVNLADARTSIRPTAQIDRDNNRVRVVGAAPGSTNQWHIYFTAIKLELKNSTI